MNYAGETEPADEPLSTLGSEPLVPILQATAGQVDPLTLATWHQALSNTVSVEVPHDLMGLWLYPSQGGVVLLGPGELAEDDLAVPVPSPHLKPEQLALVEEIVRDAGYRSATCLPIRFGKRDVALLLVADLQPDRYGPAERVLLQCVAQRVAPMLGRIARQWAPVEESSSRQQERIAGLLEAVAQANRDAATPVRFLAAVTRGLAPLLPHDHVELLVPDAAGEQYYRLGEHGGGPLWLDPSLSISREHLDIAGIFEAQNTLLVDDTYEDERWPRGFLTAPDSGGGDVRSVVGIRMALGPGSVAYILVGSIGPELYEADDAALLELLAELIAPQVSAFLRPAESAKAVAPPPPAPDAPPPASEVSSRGESAELLFRIAGLLATTSDPATSTRLIAEEGSGLLPFDKLTFALRLTEGDRVVLLEPGERRPLPDLPLVPVTGTALARVLLGQAPHSFAEARGESRLIVPLRVAGRIHGALVFSAAPPTALAEEHLNPAQRLADIVAAHFELLRRTAMLPHPFVPGWKRTEQR
jgi:GAF domain-containing protein